MGTIFDQLRDYVVNDVLEGEDVGLEATTKLLEIGVLNSMELMKMVQHIEDSFDVKVPSKAVRAENFRDLNSITQFVTELQA
ncbi:acyl carrier protein [Planktotalea sp.]|uniref:acyl carrier protein n=1 Tax=Planktotalea sp. TaxID=2029877 RepID=UPI003298592D